MHSINASIAYLLFEASEISTSKPDPQINDVNNQFHVNQTNLRTLPTLQRNIGSYMHVLHIS